MKTLSLAVFITDAVLVFLIIPFTMFYYEADQDKTADKRLKSSLMWVIVSAIICTVNLGILYGLLGKADITVRHLSSSTTNFPMFCIYGECLFTDNLDSPYFLPRICCCSNNYCWISSFLSVGITCLPLGLIASFIKRPKTVITGSQYIKEATELTKKARELKKAADSLHQEEKNGSEGKNWRKNVKAVEKMSGVATKTGACISLGGASGSRARAHMGAGTTRTQPLLTFPFPEICLHPRFELSPLMKGSIGDPATNRPLGRWYINLFH